MVKTLEGHSELFKNSPAVYQQVLMQFIMCRDSCLNTSSEILKSDTLIKIDQCAIDFRHMAMQTVTLADSWAALWCKTCLLFFRNIDNVTNYDKVLAQISNQTRDLSLGFKVIGQWCRELAGRIHEAKSLSACDINEFQEINDLAEKQADWLVRELQSKLNNLEIIARQKRSEADRQSEHAAYPVMGILWTGAALVSNEQLRNAEESVRYAEQKSDQAKQQLEQAKNKQEKAKVR